MSTPHGLDKPWQGPVRRGRNLHHDTVKVVEELECGRVLIDPVRIEETPATQPVLKLVKRAIFGSGSAASCTAAVALMMPAWSSGFYSVMFQFTLIRGWVARSNLATMPDQG